MKGLHTFYRLVDKSQNISYHLIVESLIAQAILRQALFNNRLVNVVMPEELEKIKNSLICH